MRKVSISSICIIILAALAVWASEVSAFSTYTSCSQCHGGFRTVPYKSLADGQSWASGLHDTHRTTMLSGDCNACHFGTGRTPVYINKSNGGTGLSKLGCAGCHGRAEDIKGIATIGAGLRQRHFTAGETVCLDCHNDSDPGNYTPVAENVSPPYYFTPDTAHPNKPTNSCNQSGKENFAGLAQGLDNDGNGLYDGNDPACQTVACTDNDSDGYGSNGASTCTNGTAIDCNDNNSAINPGSIEVCDSLDNNCNGQIDEGVKNTYYKDNDGDGYGTPSLTTQGCTQPAGYAPNNTDCNDTDPKEHPNQTWYQDADGDGYSSGNIIVQCARPAGYKITSELQATTGDCNDNSAAVKPGTAEVCDGTDNNCNGQVDDGIASTPTTCGIGVCAATGQSVCQNGKMVNTCTAGTPQTEGPFGSTTCGDSLDNDCNGTTDAGDASCVSDCIDCVPVCVDNDGDGYGANGDPLCPQGTAIDCNDNNAVINPGAIDTNCNGVDENCSGTADEGYVTSGTTCGAGICSSTGQLTCQSGQIVNTCTQNAAQTEGPFGSSTCSDALDNDCDGLSDSADPGCAGTTCIDRDHDGYGANGDPSCPKGTAVDCNDRKASVNPGAVEVCDGVDNNCNGQKDENGTNTYYKDADRDGYGDPAVSIQSCRKTRGYVTDNTDCNDSDRSVHPDDEERCDGKDNNCNGQIDEGLQQTYYMDADRDGYGNPSASIQSCRAPEGYVKNNTDCSDVNSSLHEGTNGNCSNQGGNGSDEDEDGDDEDDDDDDFIHNFTTGCIECHTPHNAITDCMSCHSGLNED